MDFDLSGDCTPAWISRQNFVSMFLALYASKNDTLKFEKKPKNFLFLLYWGVTLHNSVSARRFCQIPPIFQAFAQAKQIPT